MTSTAQLESIQEYADNAGARLRVDRTAGIIPSVKLLGRISKKGREYPAAVMAKALPLYEGMRVNIDHVDPNQRRSLRDRIGLVKNVTLKEDGLYGDFHYNPKHALAEQIAWDAENAPQNLGFSHDTRGGSRNIGGKVVVESIDKVLSVDLVANPATTSSLFESEDTMPDPVLQEMWSPESRQAAARARAAKHGAAAHAATAKCVELDTPIDKAGGCKGSWDERAAAHKKAGQLNRHAAAAHRAAGDHAAAAAHDAMAAKHEATHHQMTDEDPADKAERDQQSEGDLSVTDKEELTALRAEKANRILQETITSELKTAGLDPTNKAAVSDVFMEDLVATADANKRQAKITDRKALLTGTGTETHRQAAYSPSPLVESADANLQNVPPATAPLPDRIRRFAK
jgi:hypothetical protein